MIEYIKLHRINQRRCIMEQQISISESEWRVMKIVWNNSPQTLPEILDKLKGTDWSKTTISEKSTTIKSDNSGSYSFSRIDLIPPPTYLFLRPYRRLIHCSYSLSRYIQKGKAPQPPKPSPSWKPTSPAPSAPARKSPPL